jgi:hypothetical protein
VGALQAGRGNSDERSRPWKGKSSVLRLGLAPAREGECYGPKQGLRTGLNQPVITWVRPNSDKHKSAKAEQT